MGWDDWVILRNGTPLVLIQFQACDLYLEGDQVSGTFGDRASDKRPLGCNPPCTSLPNHPSRTFLLVGRAMLCSIQLQSSKSGVLLLIHLSSHPGRREGVSASKPEHGPCPPRLWGATVLEAGGWSFPAPVMTIRSSHPPLNSLNLSSPRSEMCTVTLASWDPRKVERVHEGKRSAHRKDTSSTPGRLICD